MADVTFMVDEYRERLKEAHWMVAVEQDLINKILVAARLNRQNTSSDKT